jgi:hypothetical protein
MPLGWTQVDQYVRPDATQRLLSAPPDLSTADEDLLVDELTPPRIMALAAACAAHDDDSEFPG